MYATIIGIRRHTVIVTSREQIDDALIHALALDAEWVATIRRELAREPSVTDRRGGD